MKIRVVTPEHYSTTCHFLKGVYRYISSRGFHGILWRPFSYLRLVINSVVRRYAIQCSYVTRQYSRAFTLLRDREIESHCLLEIVYFCLDMIHSHKIMNVNYSYRIVEHKNIFLKVLWNVRNQKQRSTVDFSSNVTKLLGT